MDFRDMNCEGRFRATFSEEVVEYLEVMAREMALYEEAMAKQAYELTPPEYRHTLSWWQEWKDAGLGSRWLVCLLDPHHFDHAPD